MKKIILLLLSVPLLSYSQDGASFKRNEIKLNAGTFLAGFPEISYERLLTDETGVGISLGARIDKDVEYIYGIVPHFRVYFGKKPAAGFIMEANAAIYGERGYEFVQNSQFPYGGYTEEKNLFGFGVGIAIGAKFITKGGYIGEIVGGAGRNFINKNKIDNTYPRVGVLIGKRF